MKKLLLVVVIVISAVSVKAQITYEHTYNISIPEQQMLYVTNLDNNNYKYVISDYYNDKFSLYNLDHSPFMLDIPIPVSTDSGEYKVGYITSTLFDCDSTNIEYALMPQSADYSKSFYVFRTDGTLIFSKDSVTVPYQYGTNVGTVEIHGVVNTPTGAKLFLFKNFIGLSVVDVYGLCGTLPVSIAQINQSGFYVRAYPNPALGKISFEITPPGNIEQYEFTIFNSALQPVKSNFIKGETKITLDNPALTTGTYFYSLQSKSKVFQTGKFILVN